MKVFKPYGSKERLFEMLQKVNKNNFITEGEFDKFNIKRLYDTLIRNTKIIKDKTLDDIAERVDNIIENIGINREELSDLYDNNVIQNLNGFPIIENEKYLNYFEFYNKLKEILNR